VWVDGIAVGQVEIEGTAEFGMVPGTSTGHGSCTSTGDGSERVSGGIPSDVVCNLRSLS